MPFFVLASSKDAISRRSTMNMSRRRLFKLAGMLRGGAGKGWTTGTAFSSLAYYSFERAVWRQFGERLAAHEFDLVHRITPLSPTSPSLIAGRLKKSMCLL